MNKIDQLPVTQVLLTFNSAKWLQRTIDHLLANKLPIIAVDNNSSDSTVEILRANPEIEIIELPKNIGAAGRNYGVERASTPFVAFCDDDSWYDKPGLKIAVDMFNGHPELAIITARILVNKEQRLDPISHIMAQSPLQDSSGIPGKVLVSFMGGASLARRDAYLACGGYDVRFFMGGEEETLGWKILRSGWQMRYVPQVICHHYPSLANYKSMRHFGLRNSIVNAWLHRPARSAMRQTFGRVYSAPKDWLTLKGILMVIAQIPWILRERNVMSSVYECQLRQLENFTPVALHNDVPSNSTSEVRPAH